MLGKAIQNLFPGIEFVLKHKDFFLTHDLIFLPQGFLERIGELSDAQYINHVSQVLEHIKSTISGAREYVWLISDQPIVTGTIGSSFYSRDLPVRLIAEPTIDRKIIAETKSALTHSEIRAL